MCLFNSSFFLSFSLPLFLLGQMLLHSCQIQISLSLTSYLFINI
ncbi:hypothetical protein CSUI_007117 [Cystoisospora suis]|uniref:Transmembrane protein n=1 Tax=Cystoisospora suis TaxID=483139 RepID=A0A2C6KS06_9APIC|nr:hypothetical protein CSUI_007117 [Cystoisospora suis]